MAASTNKNVRVMHACLPGLLIDFNKKLSYEQRALLDTTPFKWVTKISDEPNVSSVLLWELVRRWDEGSRAFKVRGAMIPFTPADVCLALGLPATGDPMVGAADEQCYALSISEGADVTLEYILEKMAAIQPNVGDFCRAYILVAFGVLYFARTGLKIFTDYAWLLDDLGASHNFNWACAVHEFLVESLSRAHTVSDEGSNDHEIHLCGCAPILQIWAMNHISIGETPSTPPEHPFPRILNWPVVTLRKKRMNEAFMNNRVTVALTATDAELVQPIVRDALQRGQQHQYVHVDKYQKVLATLREHEEKIREQKERILALEADVAMLKDVPPRHRSNSDMYADMGGQDASPLHPPADMYADMGGIGSSHVQIGVEMPISPRVEAVDANVDPPAVAVGGPNEHNAHDASEGGSNISARVRGKPRTRNQSSRLKSPFA